VTHVPRRCLSPLLLREQLPDAFLCACSARLGARKCLRLPTRRKRGSMSSSAVASQRCFRSLFFQQSIFSVRCSTNPLIDSWHLVVLKITPSSANSPSRRRVCASSYSTSRLAIVRRHRPTPLTDLRRRRSQHRWCSHTHSRCILGTGVVSASPWHRSRNSCMRCEKPGYMSDRNSR
jgi:hypothetical protein